MIFFVKPENTPKKIHKKEHRINICGINTGKLYLWTASSPTANNRTAAKIPPEQIKHNLSINLDDVEALLPFELFVKLRTDLVSTSK